MRDLEKAQYLEKLEVRTNNLPFFSKRKLEFMLIFKFKIRPVRKGRNNPNGNTLTRFIGKYQDFAIRWLGIPKEKFI